MKRTPDPTLSHLRHVPGLAGLGDGELRKLAALVDECDVPEGTVLVREGHRRPGVVARGRRLAGVLEERLDLIDVTTGRAGT